MNKCIYLKDTEPQLTFYKREHIIPAGIGGIKKLDAGMVSDQANNEFSKMELDVLRNSVISIPRQFYGPGKRGSLSPKKGSKSNIHVMFKTDNPEDAQLGYIKKGKPHIIPQIRVIDKNKTRSVDASITFDKKDGDYNTQYYNFIEELKNYNGNYIFISEKQLPEDYILIGTCNKKWYVASSAKVENKLINRIINGIIEKGIEITDGPNYNISQVNSRQSVGFKIDYYFRICAKTVFNYLAYSQGAEFVFQNRFNPIRNWIINGGENKYAGWVDNKNNHMEVLNEDLFPESAHVILLNKVNNKLIGVIMFYGHFSAIIELCDNYFDSFNTDGFICDWLNKKEYTLLEYIKNICIEHRREYPPGPQGTPV